MYSITRRMSTGTTATVLWLVGLACKIRAAYDYRLFEQHRQPLCLQSAQFTMFVGVVRLCGHYAGCCGIFEGK